MSHSLLNSSDVPILVFPRNVDNTSVVSPMNNKTASSS